MSERDEFARPLCVTCGYWVATCGHQCEACALDQHRSRRQGKNPQGSPVLAPAVAHIPEQTDRTEK